MIETDNNQGSTPPPAEIPSEAPAPRGAPPAPSAMPPVGDVPSSFYEDEIAEPEMIATDEPLEEGDEGWSPTISKFQEDKRKEVLAKQGSDILTGEVEAISPLFYAIPEHGLPPKTVINAIEKAKVKANAILVPANMTYLDLPESVQLAQLEQEIKRITLERYVEWIDGAKVVSPFATFNELFKLSHVEGEPEDIVNPMLDSPYQLAVSELFAHPTFIDSLKDKLDKKWQLIGKKSVGKVDQERHRMAIFLEAFERNKEYNPELNDHPEIEVKIGEMDAILFFQEQVEMLESGEYEASDDLVEYINQWMVYLNELSQEEQRERMLLIEAADRCSVAHNESVRLAQETAALAEQEGAEE